MYIKINILIGLRLIKTRKYVVKGKMFNFLYLLLLSITDDTKCIRFASD